MSTAEHVTGLLWASDHLINVVRWGLDGGNLPQEEMAVLLDLVAKHIALARQALERTEMPMAA